MTFQEFWPLYLRAHSNPRNRAAHYFATTISFTAIGIGVALGQVWIPLTVIALSYAIAIGAHRLFENNQSLVTVNPVWGAMADLKMCWLALTGQLAADLERHVVPSAAWQTKSTRQETGARLSGC